MTTNLGKEINEHLRSLGIETPALLDSPIMIEPIKRHFRHIMDSMGLNVDYDDSLKDTPTRVAKMYTQEIFYGLNYANFPVCTVIDNKMKYDEMVSQTCTVMSMCEHHFVPFIGQAYVGYIPGPKIIGLSKINRIVDFFSRRPQVQERLTAQISATLEYILEVPDVACVIRAEHLCVKFRGVRDEASHTVTSKMGGRFLSNPALRSEFLALTR
jgi:GTP cyclohydrolase I